MEKLSLRQRIVMLTSGLVFFLGLVLILLINLIAPFFVTNSVGSPDKQVLATSRDNMGNPVTILVSTPGPDGFTLAQDDGLINREPLSVVRNISLFGLVVVTGLGILASRWIAKKSLQPIEQVSQTVQRITTHNLDQRINYQGAQDDIKNLSDSFDSMMDRLELNFKDQSEFISNLAHELRTPLTSLRMNLEILHTNPQATLQEHQEFSDTAKRALSHLEILVEDLLLLAKGEKEIDFKKIILTVMVEEIIEELKPIAQENNIRIIINGDLEEEIWGDPVLFPRAIANLIENSIHYNHPGGMVTIMSRKTDGKIMIEIQDNGFGISEEQQAHIFERFYRVKNIEKKQNNGKGLGLSIAAHIIKLHNGTIEIESTLGVGSIFRITLPLIK